MLERGLRGAGLATVLLVACGEVSDERTGNASGGGNAGSDAGAVAGSAGTHATGGVAGHGGTAAGGSLGIAGGGGSVSGGTGGGQAGAAGSLGIADGGGSVSGGSGGGQAGAGGFGGAASGGAAGRPGCVEAQCASITFACGNCIDDDGDGKIDAEDEHCTSACGNDETTFDLHFPVSGRPPCKPDCFYDADTGSGNDHCLWSHECDPLVPWGDPCVYDPNTLIGTEGLSCNEAMTNQPAECASYCGPLVPNGCDCFGCCQVAGTNDTVWLGKLDANRQPTCDLDHLSDAASCPPCTQVPACTNPCEPCEVCFGRWTTSPDCTEAERCAAGVQACGRPGDAACASGEYCVTGCCQPIAQYP